MKILMLTFLSLFTVCSAHATRVNVYHCSLMVAKTSCTPKADLRVDVMAGNFFWIINNQTHSGNYVYNDSYDHATFRTDFGQVIVPRALVKYQGSAPISVTQSFSGQVDAYRNLGYSYDDCSYKCDFYESRKVTTSWSVPAGG